MTHKHKDDEGGSATALDPDLAKSMAKDHIEKVHGEFLAFLKEVRLPPGKDNVELNGAFRELLATLLSTIDTHHKHLPLTFTAGTMLDTSGAIMASAMKEALEDIVGSILMDIMRIFNAFKEDGPETAGALMEKLRSKTMEKASAAINKNVSRANMEMAIMFASAYIYGASRGKCPPGVVTCDMASSADARKVKHMVLHSLSKEKQAETLGMPFLPNELTDKVIAELEKQAKAPPPPGTEVMALPKIVHKTKDGVRDVKAEGEEGVGVLVQMFLDNTPGCISDHTEKCGNPDCEDCKE